MIVKIILVNFLTFLRIIGAIIIIPLYFKYGTNITVLVAALCYLTDCFDGILARKLKCSTFFGSIFDALSDKLFIISNLIIFLIISPLVLVPLSFEILIMIIQTYKYLNNLVIKANIIGKVKMWVLAITLLLALLLIDNYSFLLPYLLIPLILMEILTIVSYLKENKHVEKRKINDNKNISLKYMLFNPQFYQEHQNDINIKMVYNYLGKKN